MEKLDSKQRRDFIKQLSAAATAVTVSGLHPFNAMAQTASRAPAHALRVFNSDDVKVIRNIYAYFAPANFSLERMIRSNDPGYNHLIVIDDYFHASGPKASENIKSFLSLLEKVPFVVGYSVRAFSSLRESQVPEFFRFIQYHKDDVFALAFKAAKSLALLSIYSNEKVSWEAIDYTGPLVSKAEVQGTPRRADPNSFEGQMQANVRLLAQNTMTYGSISEKLKPYSATVVSHNPDTKTLVFETDTVVVGTGAGASVAALNLCSYTGHRVLAVEKGEFIHPHEFDQREMTSRSRFLDFELSKNGFSTNGNALVSGRLVGGSATINQALCAPTPKAVIREWQQDYGVNWNYDEYKKSMDRIATLLNIHKEGHPDMGSGEVLVEGAKKLGWRAEETMRNTKGCVEVAAGFCDIGCRDNRKLTPLNVILPQAVEKGLQVFSQAEVTEIMYKKRSAPDRGANAGNWKIGEIEGVKGFFLNKTKQKIYRFEIRAKKVILGGGAFGSTRILLNSGLDKHREDWGRRPAIGKHFCNHATYSIAGVFGYPIYQNVGAPLVRAFKHYENPDDKENSHVMFAIEASSRYPVNHSLLIPYESPEKHFELMKKYNHTATFTLLTKDTAHGKNRYASHAEIKKGSYTYKLQRRDFGKFLACVRTAARIMFAQGAKAILLNHVAPIVITKVEDIDRVLTPDVLDRDSFDIGSAHLMGGCRMGDKPKYDVVNPEGHSWDIENLYVMDGGILPTSLGVNPSYTIYATADYLTRVLAWRMQQGQ